MTQMKVYVGERKVDGKRNIVRADVPPTEESHGDTYSIIEGPFQSAYGAKLYVFAWNNGRPVTEEQAEAWATVDRARYAQLAADYNRACRQRKN